ncbi:MAG TPA: hypothetical protein VNQ90_14105 [Chthoniobacteraceae bacterium]|nr:hypothetical protein [Chthoniobacteraceae bacterium]
MKIEKLGIALLGIVFGLAPAGESRAGTFYHNPAAAGWFGENAWGASESGPYTSAWIDGNTAFVAAGGTVTIEVTQNVALESLLRRSTGTTTLQKSSSPSTPVTMTLGGGTVDAGSHSSGSPLGNLTIGDGITLSGDFTLTRGNLNLGGTVGNFGAHAGTIAVTGGVLNLNAADRLSANSHLNLTGGDLFLKASTRLGNVTLNGGTLNLGNIGVPGLAFEMQNLSGTGGTLRANTAGAISTYPVHTLAIHQSVDGSYSGAIIGTVHPSGGTGSAFLQLTKSGTADLTLAGNLENLQRTTTVDEGRLYIATHTSSFGDTDEDGTTAILVAAGGSLGGTGTISTLAGDHVVVAEGGKLIAGTFGAAGRTTYALGEGSVLDLSAASARTGWLRIDLGSDSGPGTSYSQLLLTSGDLVIGSSLEFGDFDFNALAGFGAGSYTLISLVDGDIIGGLGPEITGEINGLSATLSLDPAGIRLTVIPEPGMVPLALAGGLMLLCWCRLRRSGRRINPR